MTPDRLETALMRAGVSFRLIRLDRHTRTAAAAAKALGTRLDEIVKSLVCVVDGRPVLALVPGDRELSLARLAVATGGVAAALAPRDLVREVTGYPAGGVAPVAHAQTLPVLADSVLRHAGTVYCGGGSVDRMLEIDIGELARVSGLRWAKLTER